MHFGLRALSALAIMVAVCSFTPDLRADGLRTGSLLVFPLVETGGGAETYLTVTNTYRYAPCSLHYRFIEAGGLEFDRSSGPLTPADLETVQASEHYPGVEFRGYVLVWATDDQDAPISHNYLAGNAVVVDAATNATYGYEATPLLGRPKRAHPIDQDGDGQYELDGKEYERAPHALLLSSFVATDAQSEGALALIALTPRGYSTRVDLLIFDNAEHAFSIAQSLESWKLIDLDDPVFTNDFLSISANSSEAKITGATSGWLEIDAHSAKAPKLPRGLPDIADPVILGLFIQRLDGMPHARPLLHRGLNKTLASIHKL